MPQSCCMIFYTHIYENQHTPIHRRDEGFHQQLFYPDNGWMSCTLYPDLMYPCGVEQLQAPVDRAVGRVQSHIFAVDSVGGLWSLRLPRATDVEINVRVAAEQWKRDAPSHVCMYISYQFKYLSSSSS